MPHLEHARSTNNHGKQFRYLFGIDVSKAIHILVTDISSQ